MLTGNWTISRIEDGEHFADLFGIVQRNTDLSYRSCVAQLAKRPAGSFAAGAGHQLRIMREIAPDGFPTEPCDRCPKRLHDEAIGVLGRHAPWRHRTLGYDRGLETRRHRSPPPRPEGGLAIPVGRRPYRSWHSRPTRRQTEFSEDVGVTRAISGPCDAVVQTKLHGSETQPGTHLEVPPTASTSCNASETRSTSSSESPG